MRVCVSGVSYRGLCVSWELRAAGDKQKIIERRERVLIENVGRFVDGGVEALMNIMDKSNWF